jgi:hypothetical protein
VGGGGSASSGVSLWVSYPLTKKKKKKNSKSNAWVVTAGRETLMVWLMVLWVKNWLLWVAMYIGQNCFVGFRQQRNNGGDFLCCGCLCG